tara:strand:- start:104 stop:277 length:174 start_codon:yes stop_codon:yes gene_type:complete
MGMVSFDIVYTDDTYEYIVGWNTDSSGSETMNKEAVITHFVMFILGCITMYMMVNYL